MLTIGIDVAKATVEAAVWDVQAQHSVALGRFANAADGWEALTVAARAALGGAVLTAPVRVVVEPTGGYELGLALWAAAQAPAGWGVLRPNPRHVREWARSQGYRAKTDRQDALVLAQYGAQVATPLWQPLPAAVGELEQLLHRRDELETLLHRERTRQQQVAARAGQPGMPPALGQSIARLIEALEREHAQIEQALAEHLAQHPDQCAARDQLLTVPGVGARIVLPLVALLGHWQAQTDGHGSAKGLVAFAGLDPQPHQSGTSVQRHATISRQGERRLRSRLYMGALGALRGHNPVRQFYDRLVGRGKPKKLALVAAARKILVWAWAVFHAKTPFDAAKTVQLVA